MTKEDLLQDWLPRLWGALRDVRQNNNAAAEETMYELYVEMKQQTLAEKLETFGEITLEDQLSAMAIELLAAQKRVADLELQICERHFEANHIPDATKMVEGVKDSLTTQQEQGEPVVSYERFMGVEKELADMTAEFMRVAKELAESKQEQSEPVAWMKEQWSPDCGPYIEFYRDDEMGWRDRKEWTPLYTTPQQRTWVGLTGEEIMEMYNEPRSDAEMIAFGRELEAKLKEKNT